MGNLLAFLVVILLLVVLFTMINEKITKIPDEIALLLFSLIVGFILAVLVKIGFLTEDNEVIDTISKFRLDKVLMDVLLCFMLFTGASELKLPSLVHNIKPISLLAFLTTIITSVIYGGLFYLVSLLIGLEINFTLCVLLGAIVSPTDPIAATAILNKMGLTKNVTAVMEGESLFNDGTGVALFIFVKELYLDTSESGFFVVMFRELFGALFVGLAVSFLFSFLLKATVDPIKHIFISMLSVALCYTICETFEFSGVIASVVCGIYFSTLMDKYHETNADLDPADYYKDFWHIIDKFLNYVLYVLIGISFVYVHRVKLYVLVAIVAVIINFVARFMGVFISTAISRQCPDGYKIKPFTLLMTWGGLKGGLCLALAMSAIDYLPKESYLIILFVTYVTILFTTGVQGLTVGKLFNYINKDNEKVNE